MRLLERMLLIDPARVQANAARAHQAGMIDATPTTWQLSLIVLRLWHRVLFRTDTVGMSSARPVRPSLRARLLRHRAVRLPCLLAERAVAPLDFTGLLSPPDRLIRHLLGAYHDQNQFVFDLEILSLYPGKLEELAGEVAALLDQDSARSRWLRDLTVYDGYHETLRAAAERAAADGVALHPAEADDPDLTLTGALRWALRQPATPGASMRAWLKEVRA